MKVLDDDSRFETQTLINSEYPTPGPNVIPTKPIVYKWSSSETEAEKVLQRLFNNPIDFQTPNSRFQNFYTYMKDQEVWVEYKPHLDYKPVATISLGTSRKYKYGVRGHYYLLRHKQNGTNMDFCIIAKETYDVFSLARWLNPFDHILSGIYTDEKTKVSYFRAKFIEGDGEKEGAYQVEKVNGVGDFDNYMSIKTMNGV